MNFYSNGKLLITGEYLVLDGAKSLALPTKYGQFLHVTTNLNKKGVLTWQSLDLNDAVWFSCELELATFKLIKTSNKATAKTLIKLFLEIRKRKPYFLKTVESVNVKTKLNFAQNWGLGTSSTLVNNLAAWANIDAFDLQFKIFGGSAYDIACAKKDQPIIYQLNDKKPIIKEVLFNPPFKDHLFFVHLNKKQNSRDAITAYKKYTKDTSFAIAKVNAITEQLQTTNSLSSFEKLIKTHEEIISKIIGITPIQERLFSDYSGQIKSLGAWGGDFILATGNEDTIRYFKNKGFHTILPFNQIIL